MSAVAILLQVGIVFTGLGVWIYGLVRAARNPAPLEKVLLFLYTSVALQIAAEIALASASRLKEVQAMLAADRDLGVLFVDGMAWLIFAARCASLRFAFSTGRLVLGAARGSAAAAIPAAWALAYLACRASASFGPSASLPAIDAAFVAVSAAYPAALGLAAFRFLRESRRSRAGLGFERAVAAVAAWAYLPARLLLIVADAFVERGISPLAFVWLDAAFFLALDLSLYVRVARGGGRPDRPSREPGDAFEARCGTFGLSRREIEVASLLVSRNSYKDVASALGISTDTVKSHAKSLYRKTRARDRFDLLGILGRSPENPPVSG